MGSHSGHPRRRRKRRGSSCELARRIHHADPSKCARNSGGEVTCIRWTPPNWNKVVGSRGNATDRGRKFENGFGCGTDGRDGTDDRVVTQKRDIGPAPHRCGVTQVKDKTNTSSG